MGYFINNRKVTFDDLEKSGIYSKEVMDEIKKGNYHELKKILDMETRKNVDFMEPLLYAVKNEKGTYAIFEYYNEKLQNDLKLAREIIKREPELIKNTPVSRNRDFILEVAEINPKVVQHMSQDLKSDSKFAFELCNIQDEEVIKYAANECKIPDVIVQNAALAQNKAFMINAIMQDATTLAYTNENMKNDYDFMKDVSKNKEVINYIFENLDEFGNEGLKATKDSICEVSTENAILGFAEERKKLKQQMENEEQVESLEELIKKDKQLQRHIRFFEKMQRGEINPVRAVKMIDKMCDIDNEYRIQLKQFLKLDETILKRKEAEKEINQQGSIEVKTEEIEKITQGVTLNEVKEENGIMRLIIEKTKEKESKENDGTNIDRT